jgi:hypothetical protein
MTDWICKRTDALANADDDPPPPEHGDAGADEFAGAAAMVEKSDVFESVSVQPPADRAMADVASGAGAVSAPSKSVAVPYPTKSAMPADPAHDPAVAPHDSGVALLTTATFPPVAARFEVPVASAAGSAVPLAPPDASWTRYARPGATAPESAVADQDVLAADAYCTVHPVRSTDEVPRLKSST